MQAVRLQFARDIIIVVLIVASAAVRLADAQQADPTKTTLNSAQDLLNEAYRKTKGANTQKQFDDIIKLCTQALVAKPTKEEQAYIQRLLSWSSNRRGETYIDQADTAEDKGDFKQADQFEALALADFEMAVKYDPNRWKAIHNRAVSYAHIEKYDQAIADLTLVIKLKSDYVNAWFNRAELYSELGRYDKSIEDFNQVLKLDVKDQNALLGRGSALARLEQFDKAMADFNQVLVLDEKNALAYVHRAEIFMHQGRWQKASTDYRSAIKLNNQSGRQSGRAYRGAAWLMATCPDKKFRHVELAVQAAKKANELDGIDDYRNLDALAAAQANAGHYDDALLTQSKALKMAPQDQREPLAQRLQLYKSKKPHRQPKPLTSDPS